MRRLPAQAISIENSVVINYQSVVHINQAMDRPDSDDNEAREDCIYGALIERDVWQRVLDLARAHMDQMKKNIADWSKRSPKKRPSARAKAKGKPKTKALKSKK